MVRVQKHEPYNFLHCTPIEASCSAGTRLLLLVGVVGYQGYEGAHGESGSASPGSGDRALSEVQEQIPWSVGQGRGGGPSLWLADNAYLASTCQLTMLQKSNPRAVGMR